MKAGHIWKTQSYQSSKDKSQQEIHIEWSNVARYYESNYTTAVIAFLSKITFVLDRF